MLKLDYTTQFKKDLKLAKKRKKDTNKLDKVVELLLEEKPLEAKHRDHPLSGEYKSHRECHVEPDWLLIYRKSDKILTLVRNGTHSDLFE